MEKEEMEEWWTRHSQSKKKKKGDVGVENDKKVRVSFVKYMDV